MRTNRWITPLLMIALFAGPLAAGIGQATPTNVPAPITCGELAARVALLARDDLRVDCDGDDDAIDPRADMHYTMLANADGAHTLLCTGTNECAVYVQPIGTMACPPVDWVLSADTDGDGEKDCSDADDDGDYLTDEAEHWAYRTTSTRTTRDFDRDGLEDSDEFLPKTTEGVKIGITIADYDHDFARCDAGTDWADPYFSTFALQLVPGGDVSLPLPPEWKRDSQLNDRPRGEVNDIVPAQKFSARVGAWQPDFWEIPRIKLLAVMFDRDVFDYDDPIDIMAGVDVSGSRVQSLAADGAQRFTLAGDDVCRAKLTLTLSDNVDERAARAGIAHWSMGEELVNAQTLQTGHFR